MIFLMIEAIIFDLDGTLLDSVRAHVYSWLESFKRTGYKSPDEGFIYKLIGLPGETIVEKCLGRNALRNYYKIRVLKDEIFMDMVYKGEVTFYPGVKDLLKSIRVMGLKIGLATSTPSHILNNLFKGHDIRDLFDGIVTGDMVSRGKPDPDIFIKAFDILKTKPINGIIVGDSIYDMMPALSIGAKPILIIHDRERNLNIQRIDRININYIVYSFNELMELIRKLIC